MKAFEYLIPLNPNMCIINDLTTLMISKYMKLPQKYVILLSLPPSVIMYSHCGRCNIYELLYEMVVELETNKIVIFIFKD